MDRFAREQYSPVPSLDPNGPADFAFEPIIYPAGPSNYATSRATALPDFHTAFARQPFKGGITPTTSVSLARTQLRNMDQEMRHQAEEGRSETGNGRSKSLGGERRSGERDGDRESEEGRSGWRHERAVSLNDAGHDLKEGYVQTRVAVMTEAIGNGEFGRSVARRLARGVRKGQLPFLVVFVGALAGVGYVDPSLSKTALDPAHLSFELGQPLYQGDALAEQKALEEKWARKRKSVKDQYRDDGAVRRKPNPNHAALADEAATVERTEPSEDDPHRESSSEEETAVGS